MQHKARPASGSQTPKQPKPDALGHHTLATLSARLGELREHQRRIVAEVIRLEQANVLATELGDERQHDRAQAAFALLNGTNEAMSEALALADVHVKLARLRRLQRDLHQAFEIAEARVNNLSLKEQAERWAAGRAEFTKHVRAVWAALIQLDKAQGERDAFLRSIRVRPDVEGGLGWPLAGRLARTESQTYRYGRVLVDCNYLTETEFQRAFEDAKQQDARHAKI